MIIVTTYPHIHNPDKPKYKSPTNHEGFDSAHIHKQEGF